MANAIRDANKVPSILAANRGMDKTVPLVANEDGSLLVAISGGSLKAKLKEVIKLDLGTSRNKQLFNKSFKEITVPVVEGEFVLYINEAVESKGLTINRALSMDTNANQFYISNGSGKGRAEIWLWE